VFWLYTALLSTGAILASPYYLYKACTTEKYRHGLAQRFGLLPRDLVERLRGQRPLWIHAVSVGEVRAASALIERIQASMPHLPLVVSTVTLTGFRTAQRELSGIDGLISFPLDFPWSVARALDALEPRCVCIVETELWPNFLRACGQRGVPVLLLNGRISDRSYPRYQRLKPFFRRVLEPVVAFGMRTERDAERILAMGASPERVRVTGNLKYDRAASLDASGHLSEELRGALGLGPEDELLVAASTHEGEEAALLEAFRALRARWPDLKLLLVPRHPERFAQVEALIARQGWAYSKRTQQSPEQGPTPEVILLDTMGELLAAYGLATVVFMGGSLVPVGGHNVLEPAAAGKATVFGPYMGNFQEEAQELITAGGALQVDEASALVPVLAGLLEEPRTREAMGQAARQVVEQGRGAAQRSLELLKPYLDGGGAEGDA
jgi:3-deoxy-D-manno-octulosonic-acid transferase